MAKSLQAAGACGDWRGGGWQRRELETRRPLLALRGWPVRGGWCGAARECIAGAACVAGLGGASGPGVARGRAVLVGVARDM